MTDFLFVAGVTDPKIRGFVLSIKPTLRISNDGETWTVEMITPHSEQMVTFKNGQEIEHVSVVGKPEKVSWSLVFTLMNCTGGRSSD